MAEISENEEKTSRNLGSRILHGIRRAVSLFFAVILLGSEMIAAIYLVPLLEHNICSENPEETVPEETTVTPQTWMKDIADNTNLSDINLPGSHNAGTKYIMLPLFLKCQDSTVEEQLENGYRYLDIRLASTTVDGVRRLVLTSGDLTCEYSLLSRQELTLENVLKECYAFLKENPTETIVFHVEQEVEDISTEEFQTILNSTIAENQEYWYLDSTLPTLKKARGKIVLCRAYEDAAGLGKEAGVFLSWEEQSREEWRKNSASCEEVEADSKTVLYVQNYTGCSSNEKWTAFQKTVEEMPAASSKKRYTLTINSLTTKGIFPVGNPYYFAWQLNRKFMNYASGMTGEEKANLGWVLVDFGSGDMARSIYMTNFSE